MLLEITQEDLVNGRRYDANRCPLALAISRQLPGCVYVAILGLITYTECACYVRIGTAEFIIRLPEECLRFVYAYDAGRYSNDFETLTFELPPDTCWLKPTDEVLT